MNLFFSKNQKSIHIPLEVDLIRACARMEMTDAWVSWIQALIQADVDWCKVRTLANHHRVLPLVYRTLYTHFRDQVPEGVLVELRTAYQTNVARNTFLTHELLKVLNWFEEEGMDAIPIKGPVLAKGVYGDVNHRQFDDLDVLVHEEDVAAVSELLLSRGYSPVVAEVGSEAGSTLMEEGECGYFSPCGSYQLDVHWQMIPRSFLDLDQEGLWERVEWISLDGKPVRIFSNEDLLVLLSIHGMRHLWARHAWIVDLIQLLHANPLLDWDRIFDRGKPIQLERFLNVGLLLAWEYTDLFLPEWVSNQIQADRRAANLVHDLRKSPQFHQPQELSLMKLALMNARAREGIRSKLRYFMGQLLSPSLEDWSVIRVPVKSKFFYSLLRPVRLLLEYGLKPLAKKHNLQGASLPLEEGECMEIV
jgi:hypothetical protein